MAEQASTVSTPLTLAVAPPPPPPRRHWRAHRYALEIRQDMPRRQQALVLGVALAAGLALSAAVLVAAGVPAAELLSEFVVQTFFDLQNLRAVLFQAAPMVLVGLAASLAFRARFWNLGLEGQMIFGAIGATALSVWHLGPPVLRLPLMFLVATLGGLLWVAGPLWLKMKLGVNDVISTLMLNYIAGNFLLHLVYGAWKDPKDNFPHSPQFAAFERLPPLFPGLLGAGWADIGSAIALAAVAALLAWWLVSVSRAGLYLRFIDANPRMAQAVGVPVRRMLMIAVLASGALAGAAGFAVIAGQEGRLTQAFYQGYGFSGVLIAFLARNHPLAATGVAVWVAALFVTGRSLQVFYQVPFSMVQLIQALIVICVASSDFVIRHRLRRVVGA